MLPRVRCVVPPILWSRWGSLKQLGGQDDRRGIVFPQTIRYEVEWIGDVLKYFERGYRGDTSLYIDCFEAAGEQIVAIYVCQ